MGKRFPSAALAALFRSLGLCVLVLCFAARLNAAVPIEESVEEPSTGIDADNRAVGDVTNIRPLVRPQQAASTSSFDIPPTIEPAADGSQGSEQRTAVISDDARAVKGGSGLSDLFYQIQVLQQELQDLRGKVEEQDYQIRRLQQDQRQQYLDLDSRVVALSENKPAPAPLTALPEDAATPMVDPAERPDFSDMSGLSEQDAYRMAFEAMRGQQFAESMTGFQQLIENFPNGRYTPNAFYWMGEIYLVAEQDAEKARQSFMQVVNLYPDHQKTPDALYKLGVVYATLGDMEAAQRFLARVQREYPDSSAAGLAKKYADQLN